MTTTEADPTQTWGRDPARIRKALDFLVDAHGHGKRGADALHAHAIATNHWNGSEWDPETVHLAIAIERGRGCHRCRTGQTCALGERLAQEMSDAEDHYLEVTGAYFDNPASAEWRDMVAAVNRYHEHRGVGHGR